MTIRLKPEVVVITLTNLHHEVGHDPDVWGVAGLPPLEGV